MRAGEVYASKESDWAPWAASVIMTLENISPEFGCQTMRCLVIVDDSFLSTFGVGTMDEWYIYQLDDAFTRVM